MLFSHNYPMYHVLVLHDSMGRMNTRQAHQHTRVISQASSPSPPIPRYTYRYYARPCSIAGKRGGQGRVATERRDDIHANASKASPGTCQLLPIGRAGGLLLRPLFNPPTSRTAQRIG